MGMQKRVEPGSRARNLIFGALLSAGLASVSAGVQAQGIVMAGNYQNFDVLNNTGGQTCGFEMEVWGVSKSQLTRIFPSNFNAHVIRYGFGTATDFPGGTTVRWASTYDAAAGNFTSCTPVPPSLTTVPGDSCWTLGMPTTYQTAGCEHFGISTTYNVNPTKINYRWLVPDPSNPGALIPDLNYVYLPAPVWRVVPPANPALPPVVVAEIVAPPPPAPAVFGDAQWVRVYKAEQPGRGPRIWNQHWKQREFPGRRCVLCGYDWGYPHWRSVRVPSHRGRVGGRSPARAFRDSSERFRNESSNQWPDHRGRSALQRCPAAHRRRLRLGVPAHRKCLGCDGETEGPGRHA